MNGNKILSPIFLLVAFIFFIVISYFYGAKSTQNNLKIYSKINAVDFEKNNEEIETAFIHHPPVMIERDKNVEINDETINLNNLDDFFEKRISKNDFYRIWESSIKNQWNVRSEPLTQNSWHILGVTSKNKDPGVFISINGDHLPFFIKVGGELPDGSVVKWVGSNEIGVVTVDEVLVRLKVF